MGREEYDSSSVARAGIWLRRRCADWLCARRGNVAVFAALMVAPLAMMNGLAVEYARLQTNSDELQRALDSAVLAIARVGEDIEDPVAVAEAYMRANLSDTHIDPDSITYDVEIKETLNSREVSICATGIIHTSFSGLFSNKTMPVQACSRAREVFQKLEIALVLDISSSMRGRRIRELKEASGAFLDIMLAEPKDIEHTRISIVPYGGTVLLGDDFLPYLDEDVDLDYWRGCLKTGAEIMNDDVMQQNHYQPLEHFWRWNVRNPWCPPAGNEAIFLSNDPDELRDLVDGFNNLSDGTGSDIGAAFGLKALSPKWRGRFADAPATLPDDYGNNTSKALIIMTDGGITLQHEPKADDYANQGVGPDVYYRTESNDRANTSAQARANFDAVCAAAKANNILVYTIGFQVNQGAMRTQLRNCATTTGNYYEADANELAEVFSTIARKLEPLRLVN